MNPISSKQLVRLIGSSSQPIDAEICGVSTDSRQCGSNDVFIAVVGEKFDGHTFVPDVLQNGCPLAIVSHLVEGAPFERQIVVADTLDAYGKIGAYVRSQFKGTLIGLTGSAGKTTTKEEIRFILSHFGKVYATAGNHNNFIGVPESLCHMDLTADYAVIEMGMSAKGEISRLTSYVQPDVAVITNVYPMHIEFFDSYEGIARAKAEIFEGLKANGAAVVNADADFADILLQKAKEKTSRIYPFGKSFQPNATFETAQDGDQYRYNAWCVLKVVEALGLDVAQAAKHIKEFGALDGRGKHHLLDLPDKKGTYTLIDDSYSGQPESMKLAIRALDKMPRTGRKIVVLGKMAELGDYSKPKHIEIGQTVAASSIDIAVGVCPEMKDMLAQLPDTIEKYYFENKEPVADFLLNKLLQNNDIVLIKGARYSSKLYQVTEELLKKGKQE
jgi:UDP-N-acetylmuramoyl-tripeptide--D-alanyl-D-alanine ligase